MRKGKAYVCDMTAEETDEYRRLGKESPFRDRVGGGKSRPARADESRRVPRWRAHVTGSKIDMQAPNIWLRDPVLYRIRHAAHHHTGDEVVHLSDSTISRIA